jgi:molecular chaperone IbpA
MNQLVRFDANSLNKALLGFDAMFQDFENRYSNQINSNYPPYNILKRSENTYEIQVAVTGFERDEVAVEVDQNQLIVRAERKAVEDVDIIYIHRGLASRSFERIWTLAEYVEVGEGRIKNGVLTIELKRIVPDTMKPRSIKIKGD